MPTIVLAGRGQTFPRYDWEGCPYDIGAVSGTINLLSVKPRHWFGLDRPEAFPESFTMENVVTQKHVPEWRPLWNRYRGPKVFWPHGVIVPVPSELSSNSVADVAWSHDIASLPDFDPMSESPMVNGPRVCSHSMFFAVQVVARLGYTRVLFAGCDLQSPDNRDVSDSLREWEPLAKEHGIEWVNLSPMSSLADWMTTIDVPDFVLEGAICQPSS